MMVLSSAFMALKGQTPRGVSMHTRRRRMEEAWRAHREEEAKTLAIQEN